MAKKSKRTIKRFIIYRHKIHDLLPSVINDEIEERKISADDVFQIDESDFGNVVVWYRQPSEGEQ